MKTIPINNHLLIEPKKNETFMSSDNSKYQEIGTVLAISDTLVYNIIDGMIGKDKKECAIKIGDEVLFDSWLAKKYPSESGVADEYVWLVEYQNISAIRHAS